MLTQFDEICQRKDDLEKRCIQRHESPLPALKTRVFYHRDGYNKRYARYAVAYAAGKTIDPEKLSHAGFGIMPIGKSGHCLEYYTHRIPTKIGKPPTAFRIGNQRVGAILTASKSIPANSADTSPASILNTLSSETTHSLSSIPSPSYAHSLKTHSSLSVNPAVSASNA